MFNNTIAKIITMMIMIVIIIIYYHHLIIIILIITVIIIDRKFMFNHISIPDEYLISKNLRKTEDL